MAIKHRAFSMVKETISAGGTGVITLGGAVTGYDTFTSRLTNLDECYVFITLEDGNFNADANDWELARCIFTTSGTTLTRDVIESSNGDAAITVSTSHVAYITLPANIGDNLDLYGSTGVGSLGKTVVIGIDAGNGGFTSVDNVIIGGGAGQSATLGQENVIVGKDAGDVSTGTLNTFLGKDAGKGATTASSCVAIGKDCFGGSATHTGGLNCIIGVFAGDSLTSGSENTYMGYNAGTATTTGRRNTVLGSESNTNTAVDYNVSVGYRNSTSYDSCMAFGYRITLSATRQCVFGNAAYPTEGAITDYYFNGLTATGGSAPTLQACGGSGTNNVGKALNIAGGKSTGNAIGGAINFQTATAGSSGTTLQSLGTRGYVDGTDGGLVWGSPTGASQGAGTINATGVYDDSVLLTDYVFEIYYDGKPVDPEFNNYKIQSLESEIEFVKENKHLSTIAGREDWQNKKQSQGEIISQLWATVETQHLYIAELNERLKKLESS